MPAGPPRWAEPWLAALPASLFFSPISLLALGALRRLPRPVLWLLAFYALSQQLPALIAPEPLLASVLAAARSLLMFALIAVGTSLDRVDRLRVLGWGLGIVYVTALAYSAYSRGNFGLDRLSHPYMTSISLGLAGALGLWLGLFSAGTWWWRVPLTLSGTLVLLLSGSRGPLAAALLGVLLGLAVVWTQRRQAAETAPRPRRKLVWLVGGVLLAAALLGGAALVAQHPASLQRLADRVTGSPALGRLDSTDTSGRDLVWFSTLSVIQARPWGGVGSYQLGQALTPPGQSCQLWESSDPPPCPVWLTKMGNPWFIAHNAALQQLAETGPLGLVGLFALLGAVSWAALLSREPLALAIVGGLLLSTANDNTLLVPSPFFAEVFWVVAGLLLARLPERSSALGWGGGAAGAGLLVALSFPLLANLRPAGAANELTLSFLAAPNRWPGQGDYRLVAQFDGPAGEYRAVWLSCAASCVQLGAVSFVQPLKAEPPVLTFSAVLRPLATQQLRLQLYPGQAGTRSLPLADHRWTVFRAP